MFADYAPFNGTYAGLAYFNGGNIPTVALNPSFANPAIDFAVGPLPADTFDLDGDGIFIEQIPTDARGVGFARDIDALSPVTTPDIGAFEVQPAVLSLVVDTADDLVNALDGLRELAPEDAQARVQRKITSLQSWRRRAAVETSLRKGKEIAKLVGDSGYVRGVDVSEIILDYARRQPGVPDNLEFTCDDAAIEDYGDARFDLLFSRFGVMFFNDPTAAFANLIKALRPGGRLAFLCWQAPQKNPWLSCPMQAAFEILTPPEAAATLPKN